MNTFLRSFGVWNSLDSGVVGPGPDQASAQNLKGCQSCCGAAEPGSTASTAGSPYPGQRIKKDTGLMGGWGVDREGFCGVHPLKNVKKKVIS